MFGLGGSGIITVVITLMLIILAVLALLMPFFVYQIRNRTNAMDKKLATVIELLGSQKR